MTLTEQTLPEQECPTKGCTARIFAGMDDLAAGTISCENGHQVHSDNTTDMRRLQQSMKDLDEQMKKFGK
jgi:hypothetical protein